MSKYDRMVERRKKSSLSMVRRTLAEIQEMVLNNESITVKELAKRTGFSSAFFYENEAVRQAVLDAQEKQKYSRIRHPHKEILDQSMEQQLKFLMRQIEKLKIENKLLKCENQELRELLDGPDEGVIQRH